MSEAPDENVTQGQSQPAASPQLDEALPASAEKPSLEELDGYFDRDRRPKTS